MIKDITSTYVVRVTGDSMEGAGISGGDELIVNRALEPRDGNVVVAVLDGELTIKRLRITRSGVVLQAAWPTEARALKRTDDEGTFRVPGQRCLRLELAGVSGRRRVCRRDVRA